MKCGCGRTISRHMKGTCMACRYKSIKRTPKGIKVDPFRLPVPRMQPSRPMRIDSKIVDDAYYAAIRRSLKHG